MELLSAFISSITQFFSDNPSVFLVQLLMLATGAVVVFLVLFTTRDVLLRYDSFIAQVFCIVLVAAVPVVGFLLYLLFRPSMTIAQSHLQHDVESLLTGLAHHQSPKKHQNHHQEKSKK